MIELGITEAASENRKRGRPPSFTGWIGITSNAKTRRGNQDAQYASIARRFLWDQRDQHPELTRLTGIFTCEDGREIPNPGFRQSVLAEIGRFLRAGYLDDALLTALEVCRMQPTPSVKEAAGYVRFVRLATVDQTE